MRGLILVSYILMFIGAINWGMVGIFNFDLVASLLGDMSIASKTVYSLVGLSALINIVSRFQECSNGDSACCLASQ